MFNVQFHNLTLKVAISEFGLSMLMLILLKHHIYCLCKLWDIYMIISGLKVVISGLYQQVLQRGFPLRRHLSTFFVCKQLKQVQLPMRGIKRKTPCAKNV